MSIISDLIVRLGMDTKGFASALDSATRQATSSSNSIVGGLSLIGGAAVVGGFAAAGAGAIALGVFLDDCTEGAIEAQNIQAELAAVLASTGGKAGMTAEAVNKLAGEFQAMTPFEDDAIAKGESMLLTFTNIGADVFPQATGAMLNLTQKFGSMDSAATQLGKALNNPVEGISALSRVGVTFSDEQKKLIQGFMDTGDVASAQKVILAELETEFGGLAEAAGNTAGGQMAILNNEIGGIKDTIGAEFLPLLTEGALAFRGFLDSDFVDNAINLIIGGIRDMTSFVSENLPGFLASFQTNFIAVWDWVTQNEGVIVGVLAAIGVAVAAFGVTVAAAAWTALSPLIPVIAIMAAVGLAAYALYEAWNSNFGGIRDIAAQIWTEIEPIVANMRDWLAVNIPAAIETLKNYWETVLLPAIITVWTWVETNAFPIISKLWDWLKTTIPAALQTLSDFWTGTLLPAITSVWDWMDKTLFPFFKGLGDFISATFTKGIEVLAGTWETTLLPALKNVWDFLDKNLFPIFKSIGDWLNTTFGPILTSVGGWIKQYLIDSFERLNQILQDAGAWLADLASKIAGLQLPAWAGGGGGSPAAATPAPSGYSGSGGGSGSTTNNYNYTVNANYSGSGSTAESDLRVINMVNSD